MPEATAVTHRRRRSRRRETTFVKRPRAAQAYRLFGLIVARTNSQLPRFPQVRTERFEDLAAVVAEQPNVSAVPAPDIERHRAVVAEVFAHCAILPAPPGTVFRSMGVLRRWVTLHHTALLGGLAYIEGRAEGRVHVRRARGAGGGAATGGGIAAGRGGVGERQAPGAQRDGAGVEAAATRIFHELGREQAAWVVPPAPAGGRDAGEASASFLVDRSRWRAFADAVAAEQHRDPELEVRLTGPWPPYDFVRLQFGG
jgi:hypothetical protein